MYMRDHSDTELVKQFQQGDARAFAEFAERHRDRLYRMACIWMGDSMLAQDAVQEAFLRSYTGLGKFRFRSAPTTWLIRVCRNVCLEMGRQHRPGPSDSEALLAALPAAEARVHEVPEYLGIAIRQLPARQRDVVVLRLLEDLSVRETATVLGCRAGTVKAHLAKATANLRSLLDNLGIAGELDE